MARNPSSTRRRRAVAAPAASCCSPRTRHDGGGLLVGDARRRVVPAFPGSCRSMALRYRAVWYGDTSVPDDVDEAWFGLLRFYVMTFLSGSAQCQSDEKSSPRYCFCVAAYPPNRPVNAGFEDLRAKVSDASLHDDLHEYPSGKYKHSVYPDHQSQSASLNRTNSSSRSSASSTSTSYTISSASQALPTSSSTPPLDTTPTTPSESALSTSQVLYATTLQDGQTSTITSVAVVGGGGGNGNTNAASPVSPTRTPTLQMWQPRGVVGSASWKPSC
jgi:hypothetical protein